MLGNSLRLNNVKINQNIALQDFFTKLMVKT